MRQQGIRFNRNLWSWLQMLAHRLKKIASFRFRYLGSIILFCISGLGHSDTGSAAVRGAVALDGSFSRIALQPYTEILEDPSHRLTLADLLQNDSLRFVPFTVANSSLGFSPSAYWLRFHVRRSTDASSLVLLEIGYPLLDKISLFESSSGIYNEQTSGDSRPLSSRKFGHRTFVFELYPGSGESTYYLRVASVGPVQLPLVLWSYPEFVRHLDQSQLVLGIYYGVMLLVTLSALAAYSFLRERLFLYYFFYLVAYLLFQGVLNGLAFQYFWPEAPEIANRANVLLVSNAVFWAVIFAGSFLKIWQKPGWTRWAYRGVLAVSVVAAILGVFGDFSLAARLAPLCGILLVPMVIITSVRAFLQGFEPARYFAAAWGIFMLGVFVAGLLYYGLVPANFFTTYAIQIGSTLEVIVLSFALIDRARMLEQANVHLNHLANRDSLTGLLNHRSSIARLETLLQKAKRSEHSFAVIMLDLDYFKKLNDRFGHQVGDKILIEVAGILQHNVREDDCCGRYGGEEFIVGVIQSDNRNAKELAQRLHGAFHKVSLLGNPEPVKLSASFGVAVTSMEQPTITLDEMIRTADQALYRAKDLGRDRIIVEWVNA